MRMKKGGETVDHGGFYLSFGRKELLDLEKTQKFPGTKGDTFYSIPVGVMLFAGPLIGLLYVMFLPFISLAMVVGVLSRAIWVNAWKAEKRLIQASHRMKIGLRPAKVNQESSKLGPLPPFPLTKMNEQNEQNRKTAV